LRLDWWEDGSEHSCREIGICRPLASDSGKIEDYPDASDDVIGNLPIREGSRVGEWNLDK
jgi:hypothetical protein